LAKTTYWRHAETEQLNGASEVLFATKGDKPDQDHMKQAIDSWLAERNQFDWERNPLKGNNYTNIMWKSAQLSKIWTREK